MLKFIRENLFKFKLTNVMILAVRFAPILVWASHVQGPTDLQTNKNRFDC